MSEAAPGTVELRTARLVLRPVGPSEAPEVQRLADDPEIARNTLSVPHPYPPGQAEAWIAGLATDVAGGRSAVFAVRERSGGALIGVIGLHIEREHARAEMGYWIGRPWRGQGFATEAGRALLDHAFGALGLERVFASHFPWNPASGRVLEKLGMRREGLLREHVRKGDERVDNVLYATLASDPRPRA